LTKEKKKLFNDGLFTQENGTKKNKETLYTEKYAVLQTPSM
jgi:hypothetical protein